MKFPFVWFSLCLTIFIILQDVCLDYESVQSHQINIALQMLIITMSETVFMSTIPADVTQSFPNQEITDLSSFCCFEGLYVMDDYM